MEKSNLVLIGMPGVGKSTLGVLLAKALARNFVDTDVYIQAREGRALQKILDHDGVDGFRRIEERNLLTLDCADTVIATGGSVVYSDAAMQHLRKNGVVIYLDLPLASLEARLTNLGSRGVVRLPGQSMQDLLAEREPLYRRYADLTVQCEGKIHERIVDELVETTAGLSVS